MYSQGGVYQTSWLVYDRLTAYDNNLQPQPMLAESWDIAPDYKQIRLNLRKGVLYHTGREFTSDDVKYNILRGKDPKAALGLFTAQANWFSEIDTPDKYTVVLKSDQPRPLIFDFFEFYNMVDKDTVEGPNAKTAAIGTGPFVFGEWVQGDHMTFSKNMNYWQTGRPYLDGVRVSILADQQAMVTQLEARSLDIIDRPALRDYNRLKANTEFQSFVHPNAGNFYGLGVNVTKPPMDNKQVRQALNYAIDRQRFADTALFGLGQPEDLPWVPGSPGYEANKQNIYAYDLEKARALLAQAGVSNFEMDIIYQPAAEGDAFAQIYQASLANLGIKANIRTLQSAAFLDEVFNLRYPGVYWSGSIWAQLTPATFFSTGRGYRPEGGNNSGFSSDAYTKLVAAAASETDPAKQKQNYSALNDMFLDESFYIPLSTVQPVMMALASVHGVMPDLHSSFLYTDAWLEG